MSEQNAGTPTEDTPQPDATGVSDTPDAGTAAGQTENWEQRYKDVQSWATQLSQDKTQLEQRIAALDDPEQFRSLLQERGYMLEDPELDTLPADQESARKIAELEAKLGELSQWQQGLTTEQQQQQAYTAYREEVDPKLKQMDVPEAFIEQTADIAFNYLPPIQTPAGPKPDLEGAIKQVAELAALFAQHPEARNAVLTDYRASKQAPHIGQAGTAGAPALPENSTHQQRVDWALQQLQDQ